MNNLIIGLYLRSNKRSNISQLFEYSILRVSNCVSTCGNSGTRGNSSQAENRETGVDDWDFSILSFDST